MAWETRRRRFWRAVEGAVACLVLAMAGILLCVMNLEFSAVQIPRSPLGGGALALTGLLFAAARTMAAWKSRRVTPTR